MSYQYHINIISISYISIISISLIYIVRWLDKWQMMLSPSGLASFNLEHAPYDGHTFVSMFTHLWDRLDKDDVIPTPQVMTMI